MTRKSIINLNLKIHILKARQEINFTREKHYSKIFQLSALPAIYQEKLIQHFPQMEILKEKFQVCITKNKCLGSLIIKIISSSLCLQTVQCFALMVR